MRLIDLLRPAILLLGLGGVISTGQVLHAQESGLIDREDSPKIAIAYFTSYHSWGSVSLDPKELRRTGFDLLSSEITQRGYMAVPFDEMELHMQRWRIRSDQSLDPRFLAAVGSGHGAAELLVAHLIVYVDRVILTARSLRIDSGLLTWVDVEEKRIHGEPYETGSGQSKRLMDAMGEATRDLLDDWSDAPQTSGFLKLVVLPTRATGVQGHIANLTTHLMLSSLLRSRHWVVPDPGLNVWALREKGIDPTPLGAPGRAVLMGLFGSAPVLVSHLISYEASEVLRGEFEPDEDVVRVTLGTREPMHLSFIEIDVDSGLARIGKEVYLEGEGLTGLFGIARDLSLHQRLEMATDRIARSYSNDPTVQRRAALETPAGLRGMDDAGAEASEVGGDAALRIIGILSDVAAEPAEPDANESSISRVIEPVLPEPAEQEVSQVIESTAPEPVGQDVSGVIETVLPEPVEQEPLPAVEPSGAARPETFAIHVSSWRRRAKAESEAARLEQAGLEARIISVSIPGKGHWQRVVVGSYPDSAAAIAAATGILEGGLVSYAQVLNQAPPPPAEDSPSEPSEPAEPDTIVSSVSQVLEPTLPEKAEQGVPQLIEPIPREAARQEAPRAIDTGGAAWPDTFAIHVSSWRRRATAEPEVARLRQAGLEARIVSVIVPGKGQWERVVVGRYSDSAAAAAAAAGILDGGLVSFAQVLNHDGVGLERRAGLR